MCVSGQLHKNLRHTLHLLCLWFDISLLTLSISVLCGVYNTNSCSSSIGHSCVCLFYKWLFVFRIHQEHLQSIAHLFFS